MKTALWSNTVESCWKTATFFLVTVIFSLWICTYFALQSQKSIEAQTVTSWWSNNAGIVIWSIKTWISRAPKRTFGLNKGVVLDVLLCWEFSEFNKMWAQKREHLISKHSHTTHWAAETLTFGQMAHVPLAKPLLCSSVGWSFPEHWFAQHP